MVADISCPEPERASRRYPGQPTLAAGDTARYFRPPDDTGDGADSFRDARAAYPSGPEACQATGTDPGHFRRSSEVTGQACPPADLPGPEAIRADCGLFTKTGRAARPFFCYARRTAYPASYFWRASGHETRCANTAARRYATARADAPGRLIYPR